MTTGCCALTTSRLASLPCSIVLWLDGSKYRFLWGNIPHCTGEGHRVRPPLHQQYLCPEDRRQRGLRPWTSPASEGTHVASPPACFSPFLSCLICHFYFLSAWYCPWKLSPLALLICHSSFGEFPQADALCLGCSSERS